MRFFCPLCPLMESSCQSKWKRFVAAWRCPSGLVYQDLGLESIDDAIAAAEHSLHLCEKAKELAVERRRLAQEIRRANASMPKDLELLAPPMTDQTISAAAKIVIWHDWRQKIQEQQRGEIQEVEKWTKRVMRLRRMRLPGRRA